MNQEKWIDIITSVAEEIGYSFDHQDRANPKTIYIFSDLWHVNYYQLERTQGSIQIKQWQESNDQNKEGNYSRDIYSLRSIGDVIAFCQILISGNLIRAKRSEQ